MTDGAAETDRNEDREGENVTLDSATGRADAGDERWVDETADHGGTADTASREDSAID